MPRGRIVGVSEDPHSADVGMRSTKRPTWAPSSNMKRVWATWHDRDWLNASNGEGREFLRAATQVKNVWVPYGE